MSQAGAISTSACSRSACAGRRAASAGAAAAARYSRPCWSRPRSAARCVSCVKTASRLLQPAADGAVLEAALATGHGRNSRTACSRSPCCAAHSASAVALVEIMSDLKPDSQNRPSPPVAAARLGQPGDAAARRAARRPRGIAVTAPVILNNPMLAAERHSDRTRPAADHTADRARASIPAAPS